MLLVFVQHTLKQVYNQKTLFNVFMTFYKQCLRYYHRQYHYTTTHRFQLPNFHNAAITATALQLGRWQCFRHFINVSQQ